MVRPERIVFSGFLFVTFFIACEATGVRFSADTSSLQIDEQLYSRQIFVYGKSAQQSLISSHVLVKGSNQALAAEIVKNLALAGVGKLTIVNESKKSKKTITKVHMNSLCGSESLAEFARSLNPSISAISLDDESLTFDGFLTVAVCAENSLNKLRAFFSQCDSKNVKQVGCYLAGVCGFVCDNFMKGFEVVDSDGEFSKEIPLSEATIVLPSSAKRSTNSDTNSVDDDLSSTTQTCDAKTNCADLKISCIEEERLGLGIGDFTDIFITPVSSSRSQVEVEVLGPFEVIQVDNSKTAILRLSSAGETTSQSFDLLVLAAKQGRVTAKKTKMPCTVNHTSLSSMLESGCPTFNPTNGCLSDNKDKALSLCLLAAVKSFEGYAIRDAQSSVALANTDVEAFHAKMLQQLKMMGIAEPLKSIKEGGVGRDTLDYVAERFLYSASRGGQCPATVSVLGAIAAQEVIKAITKVHVPITQFLMFESLDSILLPPPLPLSSPLSHPTDPAPSSSCMTSRVYGEEVAAELAGMRVFVVGSGAIGCELLKTFALLGVGIGVGKSSGSGMGPGVDVGVSAFSADVATDEEDGLWTGLSGGGIVLADMDSIERSNLNRQLLFRDKDVGHAKAVVAAESIKQINPKMRVRAAQNKICSETEVIFDTNFWGSVDVVTTALDNVEARRYVDSQCVTHNKWLVDSGTLGTKGNTQVVIPFVSESYSSSSDPPEEDIPMCTLKSFPYHPEHCVAWARNKFDQLFSADVKTLRSCLEFRGFRSPESEQDEHKNTLSSLGALLLSSDEISSLLSSLSSPQTSPKAAVEWAMRSFDGTFRVESENLLKEHPISEVDENGVPFWGGSRRRPVPLQFDPTDAAHRSYVLWAAVLKGRTCGQMDLRTPSDPRLVQALDELTHGSISSAGTGHSIDGTGEEEVTELLVGMGETGKAALLSFLRVEDFEKDDAELGHVDFATAAANLRCRVYSLREVDRLEVQKIAGRIVPALATTTALVAGLSALEVIKIATENILRRRRKKGENPPTDASESARILKKFRNSFVNLARPLLAFAQAVEAESFSVNNRNFNMWSTIEAPKTASKLTVSILEEFLQERYGAHLQSVSVRDVLLYADFLPGSEEILDLPLDALMRRMEENELADRELESEDPRSSGADLEPSLSLLISDAYSFIDLEVVCVDGTGSDLKLPSVRVHFKPQQKKDQKSSQRGDKGEDRKTRFGAAFSGARNGMLKFLRRE